MSGHTPGPWSVGEVRRTNYRAGPNLDVTVHVGEGGQRGNAFAIVALGGPGATACDEESILANARLIAAAPDLAAVLVRLMADAQCFEGPECRCLVREARAALVKAGVR